jgi:multisubunit Na+/H+ antiporter MnhF subunit
MNLELLVCLIAIGAMGYLTARLFYRHLYMPSHPSRIVNLDGTEANIQEKGKGKK